MSDSVGACGPDLQAMYESLRGHATDRHQSAPPPQGLALLRRSGVPVWMAAWAQVAPAAASQPTPSATDEPCLLSASNRELVTVLTEMVLGGQRKE